MTWRYFNIEVAGFDPFVLGAATRSKARAEAWSRFREPYPDTTFRDFIGRCRVTSAGAPARPDDGYDYVRRNYNVDPTIGQRVRLRGEGSSSGKEGVVVYPGRSSAHVHVLLDSRTFVVTVHPTNVELLNVAGA